MTSTIPIIISTIIPLIIGLVAFGILSYKMPKLPDTTDPRILAQMDGLLSKIGDGISIVIFVIGTVVVSTSIFINKLALDSVSFI